MKKAITAAGVILLFGALSFSVNALVTRSFPGTPGMSPDSYKYLSAAENFLAGKGFLNTKDEIILPLGYPAFLAVILAAVNSLYAVMAVQFLLLGHVVFLTVRISEFLGTRRIFGYLAGAMLVLNPVMIINNPSRILTETLYTWLLVLFVYLAARAWEAFRNRDRRSFTAALLAAGIAGTLNIITRPNLMLFLPLAVLFLFVLGFRLKLKPWVYLVFFAGPAALILSSAANNMAVYGKFIFLNDASALVYFGNNPHSRAVYYDDDRDADPASKITDPVFNRKISGLPMTEKNREWKRYALDYMAHHPGVTLLNVLKKANLLMVKWNYANDGSRFHLMLFLADLAVLALALAGAVLSLMKPGGNLPFLVFLLLLLGYFIGTTSMGIVDIGNRYRMPIIPVYFIFIPPALSALWGLLARLIPGQRKPSGG
jgi:hypothetical protein